MIRRRSRLHALCAGLAFTLLAGQAAAQRIVLLRPQSSDPAILSAFAHLQGELAVQDFEVIVVDVSSNETAPDDLEQAAERAHAVAAISLLRSKDSASAEIWISDRVTGKTSRRTISTPPRSEGPTVLAVRAVDLLRASLREFGPEPKPPPDIRGAEPARAPAHVLAWAGAKPEPARGLALEAGVAMQVSGAGFRPAYGPAIAVGYDPTHRIALRLAVQGPIWGARHTAENASVTVLQEQIFAEFGWRFWSTPTLSALALGDVGVHHLSAQGEASTPYVAKNDAAWTALAGVGLGAAWHVGSAASLSLRARSLTLVPRPVVNVGAEHVAFGRPLFNLTAGLDVSF